MTEAESLSTYLREMSRVPLLDEEGERCLRRRVRHGDADARTRVAAANQRLVVKIAKRHFGRGVPLSDLIGAGNVGLMRAIDKFKLSKRCRFSTYAVHWIRQAIGRAVDTGAHTVRPQLGDAPRIRAYRQAISRLWRELGCRPSKAEIAKELRISLPRVERLEKAARATYAVKPLPDFGTIDAAPVAERDGTHDWYKPFREIEERDTVDVLMQALTERERQILRLRYGLDGDRPLTYQEIGARYNFTRSRAEQVVAQAVAKMSDFATASEPEA